MTDFELFQKEFKKWQIKFGCTGYGVFFEYADIDGGFADITMNRETMVITVRLDKCTPKKQIRLSAKHEAIHLMLNRLEWAALNRWASLDDIYSATEEVVYKLEELIP